MSNWHWTPHRTPAAVSQLSPGPSTALQSPVASILLEAGPDWAPVHPDETWPAADIKLYTFCNMVNSLREVESDSLAKIALTGATVTNFLNTPGCV